MAGRAAHRATLAARLAQAVPPSPALASSPRQRHGTPREQRAPFEALLFADLVSCSRFDLQKTQDILSRLRARCVEVRPMMIALEARAPALNRLRSWTLAADQDLFGQWQAVVTFGRIGQHGQARRHAFEDEAGLSRFVRRALLRRRSATRRIGVRYEAVEASPSVLPLLAQLGLAVRAPSAPELGNSASELVAAAFGLHSIGRVEHASPGGELGEVEVATDVRSEGHRPRVDQDDVP